MHNYKLVEHIVFFFINSNTILDIFRLTSFLFDYIITIAIMSNWQQPQFNLDAPEFVPKCKLFSFV